ncbi:MAG TPA: S1 RNA-binding domain-containing protein, partial [Bryobacteraceae bacterium]
MTIKLMRDCRPEAGTVFLAAPFGTKAVRNGKSFDFDTFYNQVIVPACAAVDMTAIRADEIYGKGDITETAWHGLQRAAVVLVDFSARSTNVAAEFALALALGKRIVVLCQDEDDIPSDVKGHYKYIRYADDYQSVQRLREELAKEIPAILKQPSVEMSFQPLLGAEATPVPGRVIIADKDYVIVLTDDNHRVELGAADVDNRYIVRDMAKKFPVGTRVQGAFELNLRGQSKYTLTAGKPNHWPSLESQFPPGKEFRGKVESVVEGLGIYVSVAHGIAGLVPENNLAGRIVNIGDEVEVAISSLDSNGRRIRLRLDSVSTRRSTGTMPKQSKRSDDCPRVGEKFYGTVKKTKRESPQGGGFILLDIEGTQRTVLLHCSKMSSDLREDLKNNFVEIGEEIYLEV